MYTCWNWIKKYRVYVFLAVWIVVYPLFLELSGIGCPFRFLFDVQCPGCGITRALKCALRLDFSSAFAYHPAFFVPPVAVVLYVLLGLLHKQKAQTATLIVSALLLFGAHMFRIAF